MKALGDLSKFVACVILGLGVTACAYDPPEQQVAFHVQFGGVSRDPTQPFVVTTAQGWTVTLRSAQVAIGPIYVYNGQPSAGTDQDDGRVVAQVLARFAVDALNPNLGSVDGAGSAVTEPAHSAEVRLYEPNDGPIADAAGAGVAVAHVAGIAQNGTTVIPFDGALILSTGSASDGYHDWLQHRVAHIPVDFTAEDAGTMILRVDPTHWMDNVVFDAGQPMSPDFATRSTQTQLASGVGSAQGVFVFAWQPAM